MFGSAYVVDVVSDKGQHFDSGIITNLAQAEQVYERVRDDVIEVRPLPQEFTVRLIKNGEVLRHTEIHSRRRV